MPAKDENTWEALCDSCGVKREDMALLSRKGMTDSAAMKAKEFGIDAKQLRDLHYQFGDSFMPMFATVVTMLKAPKPKDGPVKKPSLAKPPHEAPQEGACDDQP